MLATRRKKIQNINMKSPEKQQQQEVLPHSECWKFIENGEHSPAAGYTEYCRRRGVYDVPPGLWYLSTTITTGGYTRFDGVDKGEAIQRNNAVARDLAEQGLVAYGAPRNEILLPSELGKVPGWSQADYLSFWLYVVRAVHPEQAIELEQEWLNSGNPEYLFLAEEMESGPTHGAREAAYIEYVQWYKGLQTTAEGKKLLEPYWQPPAVVPMLDNDYSLGCRAEYYFSNYGVLDIGPGQASRAFNEDLEVLKQTGAMVTGRTLEYESAMSEMSATLVREYHDSKD